MSFCFRLLAVCLNLLFWLLHTTGQRYIFFLKYAWCVALKMFFSFSFRFFLFPSVVFPVLPWVVVCSILELATFGREIFFVDWTALRNEILRFDAKQVKDELREVVGHEFP